MDKKEGLLLLRGLREVKEGRSDSARLADFYEEIESSIRAGVSRAKILETLHKIGFTFQMRGFVNALQRLRAKRATTPQPTTPGKDTPPNPKLTTTPTTETPSTVAKPGLNIPGYKSKLTDKDKEEYQALKEEIKDLPQREQRKRMEEWWDQRQQF